jgi:hypothetical protein
MSTLFPPGPAHIAIGPSSGGSMIYVGLTENGVRATEILHEGPVYADYAGLHGMPADMQFSGKTLVAVARLIKINPNALIYLRSRYYTGSKGFLVAGELGTLMLAEGASFQVMILSPYQGKSVFSGFPAGLRIAYAYIKGDLTSTYSTNPQTMDMTFFGMMNMNSVLNTGLCWDENITGFPTIS